MIKNLLILFFSISSIYTLKGNNDTMWFEGKTGIDCAFEFRDTSLNRNYTPTYFAWDFGDGAYSISQHATHDYKYNGTYTVTQYVTDGTNADTNIKIIVVNCKANKPLKADFTFKTNDTTTEVVFTNLSQGRLTSVYWHPGDHHYSTLMHPIYNYNVSITQTYNACLYITDSSGADSICKSITVLPNINCRGKARFDWEHDTVCNGVRFHNTYQINSGSKSWNFGDGITSNNSNPTHGYNSMIQNQTYTVKFKIWDSTGCSDSFSLVVTPKCRPCYSVIGDIELQIDSSNPSKAYLINNSTGPINSHFWDFGDGSTSTLSSPNHTYTSSGNITLRYIVTDTFNCKDTVELEFEIDSNGHIKRGAVNFNLQVVNNTTYTGLEKTETFESMLKIYPNPSSDRLSLFTENPAVNGIIMYNSLGQEIMSVELHPGKVLEVGLETVPTGLYMLKDNRGQTYKLVIRR